MSAAFSFCSRSEGDPSRRTLRISAEGSRDAKDASLTPSRRLKSSPAGPMVLHAPSVWESFRQAQDKLRSLPALIKASLRNQIGLFLCRECGAGALARERPGTNPCGRFFSSWTQVPQAFAGEGARAT
jgi:hypothetical protein